MKYKTNMTKIVKAYSIKYGEERDDEGNYLPSAVFVYKLHISEIDGVDVPQKLETDKIRGDGLGKLIKKLRKEDAEEIEGATVVYEMLSSFHDVEDSVDKSFAGSNYELTVFNPLPCGYSDCKICGEQN